MAPVKVHGSVISTATMRVLACLHEKDLDYQFVPVDMQAGDHKKHPHLALNPFGQVPAFEDGDLKLFESRAITKYIAREYAPSGTQLIDNDPKKMAIEEVWMEVEAHQFDLSASELSWELVFKPMFGMKPEESAVLEQKEAKLASVLDVYEARLKESKYLGGNSFSLADLHHLPNLHLLMSTEGVRKVFESRPHVRAWCDNILARPAWAKVIEKQRSA